MKKIILLFCTLFVLASCETEQDVTVNNYGSGIEQCRFSKSDYLGMWRMYQSWDPPGSYSPVRIRDSSIANYVNIDFPFTSGNIFLKNNSDWSVLDLPRQEILGGFPPPDPMQGIVLTGVVFLNQKKDSLTIIIVRRDWSFYQSPDTVTTVPPWNDGTHPDRVVCFR